MTSTSPETQPVARPAPTARRGTVAKPAALIRPEARLAMICDAAYFLAERRGFIPGHELDDWLTAEKQIDLALAAGAPERGAPSA